MENRLLASLAERDMDLLLPHLDAIDLPKDFYLDRAGTGYCYFLTDGVASCALTDEECQPIELGLIGYDGLVGLSDLSGRRDRETYSTRMLIAGAGQRIRIEALKQVLEAAPSIRFALEGFAVAWLDEVVANVLAGFRLSGPHKLARWLASASDKGHAAALGISQDDLATALRMSQREIAEALDTLEEHGCIRQGPQAICIVDRLKLLH